MKNFKNVSAQILTDLQVLIQEQQTQFFLLQMLHKRLRNAVRIISRYFILETAKRYLPGVLRSDKIHYCNFSKGSTSFWNYLVVLKRLKDRVVFSHTDVTGQAMTNPIQ